MRNKQSTKNKVPSSKLLICVIGVICGYFFFAQAQSRSTDRVTIVRKEIVITRSGPQVRADRRRAVIHYPFVSGLRDQRILRRVRSVLDIKNIFGVSLQEYREGGWLDEFDYKVNHNANYILDITFNESGVAAYPDSHERTIPIDLKTGRILKARDVFVEEKFAELAGYVDIKLKLEVAELMKSAKDHVEGNSIIDLLADLKFEVKNLDDFSINKEGVTFLYDVGLPHVLIAFEPEGRYLFPYPTLKGFIKPTGPLGQFVNK